MIVSILIMDNLKRSKEAEEVNGLQNLIKELMHLYAGYNLIFFGESIRYSVFIETKYFIYLNELYPPGIPLCERTICQS